MIHHGVALIQLALKQSQLSYYQVAWEIKVGIVVEYVGWDLLDLLETCGYKVWKKHIKELLGGAWTKNKLIVTLYGSQNRG